MTACGCDEGQADLKLLKQKEYSMWECFAFTLGKKDWLWLPREQNTQAFEK